MASNAATAVYRFVIDDVIANVRRDFEDMGVDETIMHELQRSWENKIAQSRVTAFQAEPAASVDSYPLEEPNYEHTVIPTSTATSAPAPAPTAPAPAPAPTSAPAPRAAPAPAPRAAAPAQTYVAPPPAYKIEQPPAANLANIASNSASTLPGDNYNSNVGRPQPHAPPRPNSTSGGNRNIPQTDGASDAMDLEFLNRAELDAYVEKKLQEAREAEALTGVAPGEMSFEFTMSDRAARKARRTGLGPFEGAVIGQVDGADDEHDDTELGSDLDDSEDDMDEELDNIGLCQYDKVSRTKNKWKFVLKDGILLINGRDYLFHKANGDCDFDR
ncbi:transcription factor IIA subunit alpha [Podila verticillata]|nr:transcription factor IIA subunit alpha [Podila verticillata]